MTKEELQEQIKQLEDRIFYHDMIDHWDREDYDISREMELELSILKEKLKSKEGEQK